LILVVIVLFLIYFDKIKTFKNCNLSVKHENDYSLIVSVMVLILMHH